MPLQNIRKLQKNIQLHHRLLRHILLRSNLGRTWSPHRRSTRFLFYTITTITPRVLSHINQWTRILHTTRTTQILTTILLLTQVRFHYTTLQLRQQTRTVKWYYHRLLQILLKTLHLLRSRSRSLHRKIRYRLLLTQTLNLTIVFHLIQLVELHQINQTSSPWEIILQLLACIEKPSLPLHIYFFYIESFLLFSGF